MSGYAIPEWVSRLIERETHASTMKALTPLERQWLSDWRTFFEPMIPTEAT